MAIPERPDVPALQFELKAGFYTLPTLRVLSPDMDALDALLAERSARAPKFFHNLPLVIDLAAVKDVDLGADFATMIGLLRGYGLIPVGVRSGSPGQQSQARLMELAILPPSRGGTAKARGEPTGSGAANRKPAKVVDAAVRPGERVYAQGADLVLLAPVEAGAEAMADGHVHAYAPVYGRVLAGVSGDRSARVFCTDLRAELVAIAGCRKAASELDAGLSGRPVQLYLEGETVVLRAV